MSCFLANFYLEVDGNCSTCLVPIPKIDSKKILTGFNDASVMGKFKIFKETQEILHECHWINNKLADLMVKEFCTEPEYTRGILGLLIDFKTGLIRGSATVSNPFIVLLRYEYGLALINRHPELYAGGLLVASNYLKLAARIKGVDDELAQDFAIISKKWSNFLNQLNN